MLAFAGQSITPPPRLVSLTRPGPKARREVLRGFSPGACHSQVVYCPNELSFIVSESSDDYSKGQTSVKHRGKMSLQNLARALLSSARGSHAHQALLVYSNAATNAVGLSAPRGLNLVSSAGGALATVSESLWSQALRRSSQQASAQRSGDTETLTITDAAVKRLRELAAEDSTKPVLRISINAGGCSGFQYNFDLVEGPEADDRVFEQDGVSVVTDEVSFSLLKGAKVDFEEDLIRSAFQVTDNPSADSSCGCGSSFGPKM